MTGRPSTRNCRCGHTAHPYVFCAYVPCGCKQNRPVALTPWDRMQDEVWEGTRTAAARLDELAFRLGSSPDTFVDELVGFAEVLASMEPGAARLWGLGEANFEIRRYRPGGRTLPTPEEVAAYMPDDPWVRDEPPRKHWWWPW